MTEKKKKKPLGKHIDLLNFLFVRQLEYIIMVNITNNIPDINVIAD